MEALPPRTRLLLALTLATPGALHAQTPETEAPDTAAPATSEKRVFTPADFERFAPKTAFDMLTQLPSFSLRYADSDRGLGQASENVLINGERVADKSGGAIERLRLIPAGDVVRIEVQEAAAFGIAGLTGQIANVVVKEKRAASGRVTWSPRVRPNYAKPALLAGSLTYSGSKGKLDYTLTLGNNAGRGAIGGDDYAVYAPDGSETERRDQTTQFSYDQARFSTLLKYGGKGPLQANLNLVYTPYWQRNDNSQRRERADGNDNDWLTHGRTSGYQFSASGGLSFPLLSGTMKLIGLRSYDHSPGSTLQQTSFDSGAPDQGTLFVRDARRGETIMRTEFHWKGGRNDWELSLERAYNSLVQRASLSILQPDGSFQGVPFAAGSGVVAEKRYEGVLSLARPLSETLDLQLVGGGEFSRLRHVDRNEPERRFFRPKGSLSLAWRPTKGWDASLKAERKVGQINFYDFLSQPDLVLDRENDANPDLVPPQSWVLTGELGHDFGAPGKTRLKMVAQRVDDIVDFIPVGTDSVAVGNLPRAFRFSVESKSTIQFDPLGWKNAKLDMTLGFERTRVRDPLTDRNRPISNVRDYWAALNLRHDIPGSQFAWGGSFQLDHYGSSYYFSETTRGWEGPYFAVFAEHKDWKGFKLRLDVFNLLNARNHFDRRVYAGKRTTAPFLFREQQDQHVSQIFTFTVTKSF
jgi:hypothetical protein